MHRRDTIDLFPVVRTVLARNLEIDPEAIDLDFKFHNFIDRLAQLRHDRGGNNNLAHYLEAANIYIDLAETFEIDFLPDFTAASCVTVADLIRVLRLKLDRMAA